MSLEIISGTHVTSDKRTVFCVCTDESLRSVKIDDGDVTVAKKRKLDEEKVACQNKKHEKIPSFGKVGIITDTRMLEHKCSTDTLEKIHVERPERLEYISSAIKHLPVTHLKPRVATNEELSTCHNVDAILNDIRNLANNPGLSEDMYVVPEKTERAARLAAGCSIQLVQDIIAKNVESGFALVRPPGHHSHYDHISGFCFFNNTLLAAVEASKHGRVVIIDFDIHSSDGSAEILSRIDNNNIALVSIHLYNHGCYFPGTGESGLTRDGKTLNIAYNGGKGDKYYDKVFATKVVPFAKQFNPTMIVVSAGFDAAEGDPLGHSFVTPNGYKTMMRHIQSISRNIALVLEGGYNLDAIAESSKACVEVLLE